VHDETKVILNIFIRLKAIYDLHSRFLPSHSHAKCKSHIMIYNYFSILVSEILVLKSNMNLFHVLIFLILFLLKKTNYLLTYYRVQSPS